MAIERSFSFPKTLYSSSGMLEIKSPADEFIKYFTRDNIHASVMSPGKVLRFQIESKDLETRTVTMSILGNPISGSYETAKATFTVTPMEDMKPSPVVWTVEFEKINLVIKDPVQIVDALVKHISFIDENLYELNHTVNSINAENPADECFKAFIEAFKDEMEIEAEDWENRTVTMSLRSSHILMTRFNTFKVITTITPQEEDNGSHVKWTIEAEKIDGLLVPDLFLDTAVFIHDEIQFKLRK